MHGKQRCTKGRIWSGLYRMQPCVDRADSQLFISFLLLPNRGGQPLVSVYSCYAGRIATRLLYQAGPRIKVSISAIKKNLEIHFDFRIPSDVIVIGNDQLTNGT